MDVSFKDLVYINDGLYLIRTDLYLDTLLMPDDMCKKKELNSVDDLMSRISGMIFNAMKGAKDEHKSDKR